MQAALYGAACLIAHSECFCQCNGPRFVGGLMVASGFVPKIIKALHTTSTGEISLFMFLIIFIGWVLYTTYSMIVGNNVFIHMSFLATKNTFALFLLKLHYR